MPGASVAAVAQAGGVNANLLFKWRRDHLRSKRLSGAASSSSTVLVPVQVTTGMDTGVGRSQSLAPSPASAAMAAVTHIALHAAAGTIELDIAGAVLRLRGPVDEVSLCSVLRAAPHRMIGLRVGTRVWLAAGITDMRCGIDSLAVKVQTTLADDPYAGHVFAFRGRRGDLVKLLWSDGDGMCLLTKRLERGRFVWPQADSGSVALSAAQLSMLLEGIDWRRPERTWQPRAAV